MKGALLVAALLLCARSAFAQAADGGADGGTVFDLKMDMPEQANLEGGSELAAGVDPNAGEEIVHPADMANLQAGFRKIGSVFQSGNGSAVLQLNPFLLLAGRSMTYHEITKLHGELATRLATDMMATVALAAGSPYESGDVGRFSTLGVGFAFELLGNRSVYSNSFDGCLNSEKARQERLADISALMPGTVREKKPGESDADHERRKQEFLKTHPEFRDTNADTIAGHEKSRIAGCAADQLKAVDDALYVSLGGRWVTPGSNRAAADALVRVHREFAGVAYEKHVGTALRMVAQARVLAERPNEPSKLQPVGDVGAGVQWAGQAGSLALELTQSFVHATDAPSKASVSATLRLNLPGNLIVNISLQGKSTQLDHALNRAAGSIALSYKGTTVVDHAFDLSK